LPRSPQSASPAAPAQGRILVTGASGFVGRALCAALVGRGLPVRAAVRDTSEGALLDGCECARIGGLSADTDWSPALAGVSTVIHLAARVHVMKGRAADPLAAFRTANVAGTERLARQAAECGARRLVFVSSIKVNGEATEGGTRFAESDPPAPQDVDGCSKWEAEQALWRIAEATGLEVVVVRPPLVYGPGVKGNFAALLAALGLVYVGNLVDALRCCATHPAAAMQTYLVSDGEDLSTPDLLRRLGLAMGRPARLLPCAPGLLKAIGALTARALRSSACSARYASTTEKSAANSVGRLRIRSRRG
jgi:nucleoside-diphosphate-sugar epimerase